MRREWRIAFENLAQSTEPIHVHRNAQRLEETHRFRAVAVHSQVRKHKWPQQPAPYRSLMVGRVAILRSPHIVSLVSRLTRRETAQPIRGQQMLSANVHDRFLLLLGQR